MKFTAPFKRKLFKKEWNLLTICIIIIAVMLADIAIRGVYRKYNRLKEDIGLTELKLCRLNRILRQREKIESEYKKAIAGLRQVQASGDFLQEIEGFAKRIGLNIRNIKPMTTKDEDLYEIYSVMIEAQDDISTLAKFLYAFTKDLNGIGVSRFQINAQSKKELPKMRLQISAVAFKE